MGIEDFLTRNRKNKSAHQPPEAKPVPQSPPAPAPKPKKGEPAPTGSHDIIRHSCGHVSHRNWLESLCCPACRNQRRSERAKAKQSKPAPNLKTRIPDGSRFLKVYDAKREVWVGRLKVPGCPVFRAEAGAEKKVEHALDDLYRDWVQNKAKEPTS